MKRIIYLLMLTTLLAGQNCFLSPVPNDGTTNSNGQPIRGINGGEPSGSPIPEIGAPVSIRIINQSDEQASVLVRFFIGKLQVRRTQLQVPANITLQPIGPDLAAAVEITGQYINSGDTPSALFILGQDFESGDTQNYIIPSLEIDDCPNDPDKKAPGICGCGTPDTNSDGDALVDCLDLCPQDPQKLVPGACGCGNPDTDANNDGTADCNDSIIDCNENNKPDAQDIADGKLPVDQSNIDTLPIPQEGSLTGGPVLIGGDDADDHGFFDVVANANMDGWFYIQEGFNNIGAAVANRHKSVVCIGAKEGQAADAFISGFDLSSLPALGWTRTLLTGPEAVSDFFNNIGSTTINNTGLIYMPSDEFNVSGGISADEVAILNKNADAINNFVANGGGLFTHVQSHIQGGYAWLMNLLPGLELNDGFACNSLELTLTEAGAAVFPNLNSLIVSDATPWHDYFSGDLGGLSTLVTGVCGETIQPVIIGGSKVQIRQLISLEPLAAARPMRTPHTLIAVLENSNQMPIANTLVTFSVTSGPNAGIQGQAFSDFNGIARFTYVGSLIAGTDHASASFTDGNSQYSSNEVAIIWRGSADCNTNGIPDECELDTDEDGVIDDCDNCPQIYNPDQSNNPCEFGE